MHIFLIIFPPVESEDETDGCRYN